jgi:hypothetical protein
MLEKITEEELGFMESLHYPVATVETLFSDFNNLSQFEEEKFGNLRIYQYPFLSFESVIDEKIAIENLTREELEKTQFNLRKGVGDVYNFGARKYGKCEYINNYCSLTNGDREKFGDLIGKTANVISLNQKTLKLEESKAYFYDNGIRDCYKLILKSGKEITVTGNHPFLTENGWKSILELKEKDFIATPRKYNINGYKKVSKNEDDKIIKSDIYWDIVKKIVYIDKLPTVAVSVPKYNNYISNDIISHNTLVTEKLDIPLSMINDDGFECGFSSIDAIHIRGVLDVVKRALENHPILKIWKPKIKTHPNYLFEAKNGWVLEGINMNRNAKNPGEQWYSKHFKKVWIEEASLETMKVYNIRKEALSELGAILRISGMTNFTRYTPAGRQFYAPENRAKIINLPQFCNPFWDEKEKIERIKEYGGESDINYLVFVKGEIVEDGVSEIDMERVKQNCYLKKRKIIRFEINKNKYKNFRNYIVVERPKNADRMFLVSDVGDNVTEIVILSEVEKNYNYLYNITLYNLIKDEQEEVFKWLIDKINANVVGIDCGDALGRILCDGLEKKYSKENIVRYAGASKINVDFERDEKGEIIFKKGKPVFKQEFMSEWSINWFKNLLYNGRIKLPQDFKLETQLSSVISSQSGTRRIYACICQQGDHLFDTFRVFSVSQWLKKDFNQTKPMGSNNWGIGLFGSN